MNEEHPSASNFLVSLGESINKRRLYLGLSQQELAGLAGLHRTYVSDIERGARNPTVGTILRIAQALQIQPSRLFRSADETADQNERLEISN